MSAEIFACGGSSLFDDGCKLCLRHVFNKLTKALQWRSAVFVSRIQDKTRVTHISTTD